MRKTLNSKFQTLKNSQKGFTLVEVLVVALIIGVVGYLMADIVTRSLAGSQKTVVIGNTKQNGQVAMDAISNVIRTSESVACLDDNWSSSGGTGHAIVLYTHDGRYVRFIFNVGDASHNGYFTQDVLNTSTLLLNGDPYGAINDTTSVHRLCSTDSSTGVPLSSAVTVLTDRDVNSGVNICTVVPTATCTQPIFTVLRSPGTADTVTIQFNVSQAVRADSGFQNNLVTPTQFRDTIQLR
jgi:prepilin-type N-terminal cleavage/methylation domain-containing protein